MQPLMKHWANEDIKNISHIKEVIINCIQQQKLNQ